MVDRYYLGEILGWRWCRHEIESYLIDPGLVHAATTWSQAEYTGALVAAGKRIRNYQVARWVVGEARRSLPPHYELRTRPENDHEFFLPIDLALTWASQWTQEHLAVYLGRVEQALGAAVVERALGSREGLLTDDRFDDVSQVLAWCSGKDLLAALESWLQERGCLSAGAFRALMRDWIIDNPDLALDTLPEWRTLVGVLRGPT